MNPSNFSSGKRIVVPLTVKSGELVPTDCRNMPLLRDGSLLELNVDESSFVNKSDLERFDSIRMYELLPKGSTLFALLSVPTAKRWNYSRPDLVAVPPPSSSSVLIPFQIEERLMVRIRGGRVAGLLPCATNVPLANKEEKAASVNQAYTALSELHETGRRSHTGNVFSKVYFKSGEFAQPLSVLRQQAQGRLDEESNKSIGG